MERAGESEILPYEEGYNVADFLLEIASAPPTGKITTPIIEKSSPDERPPTTVDRGSDEKASDVEALITRSRGITGEYAATFLTQFQVLCGREWKLLCRYVVLSAVRTACKWHDLGIKHSSLLIYLLLRFWVHFVVR